MIKKKLFSVGRNGNLPSTGRSNRKKSLNNPTRIRFPSRPAESKVSGMKTFTGPLNLSCLFTQNPETVVQETIKTLEGAHIDVRRTSPFKLLCDRKVNIEFNRVNRAEQIFAMRIWDDCDSEFCNRISTLIFGKKEH